MSYVIVGDTEKYKDCLIYAGGNDRALMEETLDRILNNPNENDKIVTKGHSNIRIKETNGKNWWDDTFLCN